MRRTIKRVALIVFATVISLFIAEGVTRLFFDPVDYLWRKLEPDEILRHRVKPHAAAHDAWGYRNEKVPERADIVAIGDSQTYGTSALAKYSWPSTLGRLTGKQVYNMSLGGYGPAEYFYLMEHQALHLKPDLIVAGFYLGNDLADTFTAVYSVPFWNHLRNPELPIDESEAIAAYNSPVDNEPTRPVSAITSLKKTAYGAAGWLAGHSVLYRMMTVSYIGDMLRQNRMIESGEEIVMFRDDEHGIDTGFTPARRLLALDINKPDVREGLRLSLYFLNEMNELAKENGVGFLVVMIPTKESVYADFIDGNDSLEHSAKIDRLIQNERLVNGLAKSYFERRGIPYVDVLGPLRSTAGSERIYPSNYSGHCNENGYAVIAEAVQQYLYEKQNN